MIELNIDIAQLDNLAERLGKLDGATLGQAAIEAVNAVTTRFDDKQQKGQRADIGLTPAYIASKTLFYPADNPRDARATITTRGDLTVMHNYPGQSLRDPSRLDRRGHPLGNRQAGVRVAIKPSAPVTEPQWFLMRLKNGAGEGVFVRTSAGAKKKQMYGPSPYSLFRHQALVGEPELLNDLEVTGAETIANAVQKAIA